MAGKGQKAKGKGQKGPGPAAPRGPETVGGHGRPGRFALDGKDRVGAVAGFVPDLVRMARQVHRGGERVKLAVVSAWGDLAGVVGWTPEMIERVEEAMGRG